MAGYWPSADHPSAKAMNEIPKVVFSRTLKTADEWPETRIASGDTAEEIAKLKAEPGKDLVAAGGTEFMHSLIKLGVVDEYRLWVLPAVTGKGAALFPELDEAVRLRLVKARPSRTPGSSSYVTHQPTSKARKQGDLTPILAGTPHPRHSGLPGMAAPPVLGTDRLSIRGPGKAPARPGPTTARLADSGRTTPSGAMRVRIAHPGPTPPTLVVRALADAAIADVGGQR
jgi:dihydrofolate reductase